MNDSEKIGVEGVKFLPVPQTDAEAGKVDKDATAGFSGLSKEDLLAFTEDPFWVRTRKILFVLFWVVWVGMIAAAVVIIVVSPRCPARPTQMWWETSAVYTVDVRSFMDSDGDGVGDLDGVANKLDYVQDLGASALLLRPIFATAKKDALSRDTVDFRDVDGDLGNKLSLNKLVKAVHKRGMKILLEMIPNHSSDQHNFFKESRKGTEGQKDFYVWSKTDPNNNWKTVETVPEDAWTLDAERNEYFYHIHGKDMPDFNFRNEAVRTEIIDTVKYWLMDGQIDGFLIGEADYLYESQNFLNNPYDDTTEAATFITQLRAAVDQVARDTGRDRVLIVDAADGNVTQQSMFYHDRENPGAHVVVNNQFLDGIDSECKDALSGKCVASIVAASNQANLESGQRKSNGGRDWNNWGLSTAAKGRIASKVPKAFVDGFNMLMLTARGTPLILYGDEIGMKNSDKNAGKALTAMQWDSSASAGFTQVKEEEMKVDVNADTRTVNVKFQNARGNDDSHLSVFKLLLSLRTQNSFAYGDMKILTSGDKLFSFVRQAKGHPAYYVAINFGGAATTVPGAALSSSGFAIPDACEVVATTSGTHADFAVGTNFDPKKTHVLLQSGEGVVVKLG